MSKNLAEDTLETRLIQMIAELDRRLRELTTPQPLGADVMDVQTVPAQGEPPTVLGPITLESIETAADYENIVIDLDPGLGRPIMSKLIATMYIGAYDANHAWPNGSALTPGQRSCTMQPLEDELGFDPDTGVSRFILAITNWDSVTNDFYISYRLVMPRSSAAVVT